MFNYVNVMVALGFHLVDFITGLISAVKNKNLKSSKMRDGMFKKVGFVMCYVVGILIDNYGVYIGFHLDSSVLTPIIIYSVTCELVSIAENINKINPDILPEKLTSFFHIEQK